MKTRFLFLMFWGAFSTAGFAQGLKPDWVSNHEAGKSLENVRPGAAQAYFGIGVSKTGQEEANEQARLAFVKHVSLKIDVSSVLSEEERNGAFKQQYESRISAVSSARMTSVSITETWSGGGVFYALIQIPKDEYNKLVLEEVNREIERQKAETRKEIEEKNLAFEKQKNEEELRAKREQLAKDRKAREQETYGPFYKKMIPTRMVNALTGTANYTELMLKGAPFSREAGAVFGAKKFWIGQVWAAGEWRRDGELHNMEAGVRAILVDGTQGGHGLSVAAGFTGFVVSDRLEAKLDGKKDVTSASPAAYVTYAMPQLFYSHLNLTADARRVSTGIHMRPFYNASTLGESVELLAQGDLILHKKYRFDKNEPLLLHGGVRFNTGKNFSSAITVENFRTFFITLEIRP